MSTIRIPILLLMIVTAGPRIVFAEMIVAIPSGVFPTGTSVDAIAGGLSAGSFDLKLVTPPLPSSGLLAATFPPSGATATNTYDFKPSFAAAPAFLSSVFSDFSRSLAMDQRATAEGHVQFKVDVPAFYTIDGTFIVVDSSGFGKVELEVELLDVTAGFGAPVPVFSSKQVSTSTTDQTFIVGGGAGDTSNVLIGTSSGLLDPTKVYTYRYLANTIAIAGTTGGATASGGTMIKISAIPETSSFCMMSAIGLAFLCGRKRSIAKREASWMIA